MNGAARLSIFVTPRARRIVVLASVTLGAAAALFAGISRQQPELKAAPQPDILNQTVLAATDATPLSLAAATASDGTSFGTERLEGRWSIVFFGFTSCPQVCPMTLQVLDAVARDPASGVAAGGAQILFVSIDTERDTAERLRAYLDGFGSRVIGLTATRDDLDRFVAQIGAGYRAFPGGIDHSTSLFVLDPHRRLAGVLLRPSDAARIVRDFRELVQSHDAAEQRSAAL